MSCRSCWTYPQQESSPRPLRRPVSSHITAAVSDEASHPAEHRGSPVPLSPWQLVTCVHPIPSLPPSACLFTSHSILISSPCFLKRAKKSEQMTCTSWPVTHTHTHSLNSSFYFLSFSIRGLSSRLFHLILRPVSSSLWGHRVRRHQSCWKAPPYRRSHASAHYAQQYAGDRWRCTTQEYTAYHFLGDQIMK